MIITKSSTRLVATAAGVAVALALLLGASMPTRAAALSQTQVQSILNLLSTFGADAATISNVQNALNGLPSNTTTTTTTTTTGVSTAGICPFTWSTNLKVGSTGQSVMKLQQFLNMDSSTMVAATGAGSAGKETQYYGPATRSGVMKFQTKYGISPVGEAGPITRAKLNSLCAVATTPTPVTPFPVTPGGVVGTATVTAGAQPANTIAPQGASRVPYTAFVVTAGASPVTLNNVTVMRQGPSLDTDFAGVTLINASTGAQLGTARVLDANHSATIGTPIVIPAGTSMTFLVAGNIAANSGSVPGGGDVASFAVTAVNTTATLTGALPIIGASNTINTSLTIGSATIQTSSFDPNNATTQPIGTTAQRFTAIRIQAGSIEDLTFKSITWYQSGSASGIQNAVSVVNGTSYPAVADSSGRYYTSIFPTAIVIPKGQTIDVYIQGDLGANTTPNTYSEFDIYRNTDIYLTGNQYGFGVTPTASASGGSCGLPPTNIAPGVYCNASSHQTLFLGGNQTPFIQGSTISVTPGTFSTIQSATSVGAQNIAINVPNMPLGGFQTNLTGEAIQAQSIKIHFTTNGASNLMPLQNVSLVSESGSTISGPFNAVCDGGVLTTGICATNAQTVTFTGASTFPTGSHTYTIKGQVQTQTNVNNVTIQASTNPQSDWTNITGQTTGNNVAIGVSNFTMNTMTIQAATLVVSNGSSPTSQNVVAGGQNIQFATINLDGAQSGENVRMSSLPMKVTFVTGTNADLSNCTLWNTSVSPALALNTGSRVVNSAQIGAPTAGVSLVTFSFDNSLTIPKGSVVGLSLTCNVNSAATPGASYKWEAGAGAAFSATGETSGTNVSVITPVGTPPTMTISGGSNLLTGSTDSSAPGYFVAAGGTTGVTVNVIKFRATDEALNLQKLGLKLTGNTGDVTQASIYAGNNVKTTSGATLAPNTLLGTMIFSGTNVSTSTLNQVVQLPVNQDATLIIKADLADIGTSQPGTEGDLVKLDFDSARGVGASSGKTIDSGSAGVLLSAGVRVFNTFPVISLGSGLSNTGVTDGNLMRFVITPDSHGPVGINKLSFAITASGVGAGVNTGSVNLFAYTDSNYSQPANTGSTGGVVGSTTWSGVSGSNAVTVIPTPLEISSPMYFQLTGIVAPGTNNNYGVNTKLLGDSVTPTGGVGTAAAVSPGSNFVWSPNAFKTAVPGDADWTNGTGLQGLPSIGLNMNRTQ